MIENPSPSFACSVFDFPTCGNVVFCLGAGSERMSATMHKAITLKFAIPTALILALGISISAVHLPDKHLVPVDYFVASSGGITELPGSDGRLSRVHLLLSGMK